jgi:site-specific recombinase XerD
MLIYSSGLRANEAANLKTSNIGSKNMKIFVSKGNKDRYIIISKVALDALKMYWKECICTYFET